MKIQTVWIKNHIVNKIVFPKNQILKSWTSLRNSKIAKIHVVTLDSFLASRFYISQIVYQVFCDNFFRITYRIWKAPAINFDIPQFVRTVTLFKSTILLISGWWCVLITLYINNFRGGFDICTVMWCQY